ncbi:MAG: ATP-binding protein [Xanthomonadales bacterium]|nr:ATP-binding protein [Xanthomonadales bacterium]
MNQVEKDILAAQVLYRVFEPFEHLVDVAFPKVDSGRLPWQLGRIMGYGHVEIERALKPEGVLIGAGLVRVDEGVCGMNLSMVLELNRRVLRLLTNSEFGVKDLLHHAAHPCPQSGLALQDFDFMAEQRDLVLRYLEALRNGSAAPGPILFDGPPGVGKSEMARLLASHLGFDAYAINELDSDGDPAMPGERVQYLRLCERMIERNGHALMVFDEADAVLGGNLDESRRFMRGSKAGLVRLLETVQVPMIWITNHADMMDPAIARRFDLTIRFRDLPKEAREGMIQKSLPEPVRAERWLQKLGGNRVVTPARIAQAERVARTIAGEDDHERARLFKQVIEENLDLRVDQRDERAQEFELPYRLEAINADENLPGLVDGIRRSPCARLCLYGPPGTGKTRFVRHLAEEVGVRVCEYRASDLLDKFVGESEGNIRRMFEECDRPDRLLLLDEADSLIASRSSARQRWEVNQVNELLKGLENFRGLFVASTNLMDNLDSAVMRRLDFKVHFGWLEREPRWRLFLDLARHVGLSVRGGAARKARRVIDDLDCLTPGDYATLARRLKIRSKVGTAQELAELLEREMKIKPEARERSSIGFTARL